MKFKDFCDGAILFTMKVFKSIVISLRLGGFFSDFLCSEFGVKIFDKKKTKTKLLVLANVPAWTWKASISRITTEKNIKFLPNWVFQLVYWMYKFHLIFSGDNNCFIEVPLLGFRTYFESYPY